TTTPLGALVQLGGFFPQVFKETPDPTTRTRPAGDLGREYRLTYRVPGPGRGSTLVQDVYPYAKPSPVTHMSASQHLWGRRIPGGWFVASPRLKPTLVAAGLPASPPPAALPPPPASSESFPWAWLGGGVFALAVLLALVLRRRDIARLRTPRTTA